MKDPAVLFYTSDFLTGCIDLDMEERGQYITMLCLQHQKGRLSEKTIRLSLGSVSVFVLEKFEKDEDGNYYNKRMEDEINKRREFTESRRVNGKKGGRPNKPSAKPSAKPSVKPNGKPKKNLIENENIYINNNILNKLFIEYLDVRKKEKLSNSDIVINRLIKKLREYSGNKFDVAEEIIMKAITSKWKDFYPLKN